MGGYSCKPLFSCCLFTVDDFVLIHFQKYFLAQQIIEQFRKDILESFSSNCFPTTFKFPCCRSGSVRGRIILPDPDPTVGLCILYSTLKTVGGSGSETAKCSFRIRIPNYSDPQTQMEILKYDWPI